MKYISYLVLSFLLIFKLNFAQQEFQSPLSIPMYLSGSFAELRSNHFHSGLDIKTLDREGLPVFSTAEGWVSRIKVSPWGFGTALYITHPNGYTSVYAHLSGFNKQITDYVLKHQYRKKSFSVDLYLKKNQIKVKALDLIAFSGNTGGSGGPHLHFELRESASQKPCNPLDLGIDIKDDLPPVLKKIAVYEGDKTTFYNIRKKSNSQFFLDTISVRCDSPQFGISVTDYSNGSRNPLGVNKIRCFVDDKSIYKFDIKSFAFNQSRYINAHIDYATYKKTRERFHKLYLDEGNRLGLYQVPKERMFFDKQKSYHVRVEVYDSKYNKSTLNFVVKRGGKTCQEKYKKQGVFFAWNKANVFSNQLFSVLTPTNAFYEDCYFDFQTIDNKGYVGGLVYEVGDPLVPIHKKIDLNIKQPEVQEQYLSKLTLVEIENDEVSALSSKLREGYLSSKIRNFGRFGILIDTVPPNITFVSKDLKAQKNVFVFKIEDDLSGIGEYSAYLNGKWILFKYDYKTGYYYYDKDFSLQKNNTEQTLEVKVIDDKGNEQNKILKFIY